MRSISLRSLFFLVENHLVLEGDSQRKTRESETPQLEKLKELILRRSGQGRRARCGGCGRALRAKRRRHHLIKTAKSAQRIHTMTRSCFNIEVRRRRNQNR